MGGPQTEAGRFAKERMVHSGHWSQTDADTDILDIEQQAVAARNRELAEAVRGVDHHDFSTRREGYAFRDAVLRLIEGER